MEEFDELDDAGLDDSASHERRLPPFVARDRHWGNWYATRGSPPAALYNVEWGNMEFSLSDLRTKEQFIERVRHFANKGWRGPRGRGARELDDLYRALDDLGVTAKFLGDEPANDDA